MGIASPTEVGEWVEKTVGPILSAREDQIALIESNSAQLRVSPSGRPDAESDSDMSGIPLSGRGGPPSGTMPMSQRHPQVSPVAPVSVREESTGSKPTTQSMTLPVDKKLPILATALGLLVLLVVVGVVIAGKFASPDTILGSDNAADSASASASVASAAPSDPPSTATMPPPPPTENVHTDDPPVVSASATQSAKPKPPVVTPPPPQPTPRATTPPKPSTTTTPTATQKKNCDPPYTIDANGRKHYKLECM